jgi:hypothetical protein
MFSLNWFKSKKERQLEELRHEIQVKQLEKELERIDNAPPISMWQSSTSTAWQPQSLVPQPAYQIKIEDVKPYKTVKMVNNVLTVVLNDGSILSKSNATEEDFEDVRCALDEFEIIDGDLWEVADGAGTYSNFIRRQAERL